MRITQIQKKSDAVTAICRTGLCSREVYNIPLSDLNGFELKEGQLIEADVDDKQIVKSLMINQAVIFSLSQEEYRQRRAAKF